MSEAGFPKLPEGRKEVGQTAFGSSPRNGNLPFFISSAWRGRLEDGPWWDPVRLRHAFYGISHQESGGLCENGGEASSLFHGRRGRTSFFYEAF